MVFSSNKQSVFHKTSIYCFKKSIIWNALKTNEHFWLLLVNCNICRFDSCEGRPQVKAKRRRTTGSGRMRYLKCPAGTAAPRSKFSFLQRLAGTVSASLGSDFQIIFCDMGFKSRQNGRPNCRESGSGKRREGTCRGASRTASARARRPRRRRASPRRHRSFLKKKRTSVIA